MQKSAITFTLGNNNTKNKKKGETRYKVTQLDTKSFYTFPMRACFLYRVSRILSVAKYIYKYQCHAKLLLHNLYMLELAIWMLYRNVYLPHCR